MGIALMARKNSQNTRGAAIAKAIMEEYQPQTREEMQDAIKDVFGPMFEAMLQGEMDSHLGCGRRWRIISFANFNFIKIDMVYSRLVE